MIDMKYNAGYKNTVKVVFLYNFFLSNMIWDKIVS